ncbi:MAG: hypothetical protein ACLQG5_04510 [Methanobacterium sp.]|jgi:hypothetical protein
MLFIGTILRQLLAYVGLHGTYVVLATIVASALIGTFIKQRFNIGNDKSSRRNRRE